MNNKYKKLYYVLLIALLLYPLYMLGNPAQRKDDGFSEGGVLAQKRMENNLAEAKLGQIDPAGSAMQLATFGMRGVAISLLWNRSLEYEKRSDWDNVVATANQIITLEPHFITIWDFVGWKLAYNASAQFDDYRERYRWVIRGFEFVQRGTSYNQEAPKLYVRAGWTISQKIGIADEKKQYRRLFREDDELAERQSEPGKIFVSNRDNWLLGHAFYKKAEELYETRNGDIGKETRLLFYGRAPLNRIRYAEWMEIDGCGVNKTNTPVFDEENTATAWKMAQDDWTAYSSKVVSTTIEDKNNPGQYRKTSLNIQRETQDLIDEHEQWIVDNLPEGVTRETVVWDRWNNELTDRQRASMYNNVLYPVDEHDYNTGKQGFGARVVRAYLDGKYGPQAGWENWREKLYESQFEFIPEDLRELARRPSGLLSEADTKDYSTAYSILNDETPRAAALLTPTPEVLATYLPDSAKAEAEDRIAEINDLRKEESFSRMFRDIMGADYHEREVAFEQTLEAREARRHRQAVRDEFQQARPEAANREFLACFDSWVALLNRKEFEDLRYLPQMQSELIEELDKYVIVLDQLETIFPREFSFQEVIRRDQQIVVRLRHSAEALEYIEKTLASGNSELARTDAQSLLEHWNFFNDPETPYALAPLPEITNDVFKSLQLFTRAWEASPQA
ncbi:MAG: hypothetical protein HUK22_07255, partial [Thermoguttaceae bacterium]|nr:hypothetical protein [Thermoguttaceae bacterium]